ncbi:MAG TPA: DNA alkylation repair protein [Thermoanaerobaculia bacterium]|nr:DNA alkylation repair protein [Thermoanaerobaculia bacterium]
MVREVTTAKGIERALRADRNPLLASHHLRFFKCGPGEYGEGDAFLGVAVPPLRALSKRYKSVEVSEAVALLQSKWHEVRLLALMILVHLYERGDDAGREAIYRAYLANTNRISNWDLVDVSAHKIVGAHLRDRDRTPLLALAKSEMLWERRIAIIATLDFIRQDDFRDTLRIVEALLTDRHDLIHKAAGWMLREVGKRDQAVLERFLRKHARVMPRTMLRYAIERFPAELRAKYMKRD